MDSTKNTIIKDIAEHLDAGFNCYYNRKTDELLTIPDFSDIYDDKEFKSAFKVDLKKIEDQKANFIRFEVLESFESFKIMEGFVKQMTDEYFKIQLSDILQRKKPFQNFKTVLDDSKYRQEWFDFKQKELEKIVENQLNQKLDIL